MRPVSGDRGTVRRARGTDNPFRDRPGWLPRQRYFAAVAALQALADEGMIDRSQITQAMARYGIAPDQPNPWDG